MISIYICNSTWVSFFLPELYLRLLRPLADHVLLRLLLLLLLHVLEVLLLHGGRRWPAAALPCAVAVEQLVGARDGVAAVVADDGRILWKNISIRFKILQFKKNPK